jgi:hypothetical protein
MPYWKRRMLLDKRFPLTEEEETLLKKGPKSLAQAWRLSALKYRYLRQPNGKRD